MTTLTRSPFRLALVAAALLWSSLASAQSRGYVDLDQIRGLSQSDVTVDINLGGWLMAMVSQAADEHDDAARIMRNLENVRVRVFNTERDNRELEESFADLSRSLVRDGWDTLVKVRDGEDHVDVMVMGTEDMLEGITVLVISPGDEAVMINITGLIDPRDVATLLEGNLLSNIDLDLDF